MDATLLSDRLSQPIQVLGMSYYFDPGTAAAAEPMGLNVFEFYGLGRGGVLGGASVDDVHHVFRFFHRNAIEFLYGGALAKHDPVAAAVAHVQAAYAFADRTFGGVPAADLQRFAELTNKVVGAVPAGLYPLFDGYRSLGPDTNVVHAAYFGTILLRELRGGVHTVAGEELGLDPVAACYLEDPGIFKLHGYKEEDIPADPESHRSAKEETEVRTTARMATYFEVLSDDERDDLDRITSALSAALATPVAVA